MLYSYQQNDAFCISSKNGRTHKAEQI